MLNETKMYWLDLFTIIDTLKDHPELHDQESWHSCDNKHCIAGWMEVVNLLRLKIPFELKQDTSHKNFFYFKDNELSFFRNGYFHKCSSMIEEKYKDCEDWATEMLGINYNEAFENLFNTNLDIDQIYEGALYLADKYEIFRDNPAIKLG